MGLILKHVKQGPSGFTYRRRVPRDVADRIPKLEFKKALGPTRAEALSAWPVVHADVERQIEEARREREAAEAGGRAAWELAKARAASYLEGVQPEDSEDAGCIIADAILSRYPTAVVVDEHGRAIGEEPRGAPELERMTVGVLRGATTPPEPTLEDARRLYLKERLANGTGDHARNAARLDRILSAVREALGGSPALKDLRREDAKKVRDHMLGLRKRAREARQPASVKRELIFVKAVVNHALREFDLTAPVANPFNRLALDGGPGSAPGDADKRDPLPPEVLRAVRRRILAGAEAPAAVVGRLESPALLMDERPPCRMVGRESASTPRLLEPFFRMGSSAERMGSIRGPPSTGTAAPGGAASQIGPLPRRPVVPHFEIEPP